MKAIVYHKNGTGDALRCEETEKPTVGENEVLIKVRAASVNPLDCHLLKHPFMRRVLSALSKTKNPGPGRDVAGVVETVGSNVNRFKPGDAVFGSCGGAFAEYACAPQSALAVKPNNLSFEHAASAPVAGLTALQGLRDKGQLQPGQKVLINGAAGGVGTFAVQIAKYFGAEVTGVCSTKNVDMIRSLGGDHVIDYTREDISTGGLRYDLILDLVANYSFSSIRRALNPKGIYIGAGMVGRDPSVSDILSGQVNSQLLSRFVSQKFVSFIAKLKPEDLATLAELMVTGKVTPVIDRRFSLSEVPEAVRYVTEGHARGKVIITMEPHIEVEETIA